MGGFLFKNKNNQQSKYQTWYQFKKNYYQGKIPETREVKIWKEYELTI